MLLKKGIVIMLDSNEKSATVEIEGNIEKTFPRGSIVFNVNVMPSMRIVEANEVYNESMGYNRVHLHLVVEEELVIGGYNLNGSTVTKTTVDVEGHHVIASTDRQLGLPKFSRGFLERYEDKQGIDSVFVVYEDTLDPVGEKTNEIYDVEDAGGKLVPKVNRNNIISLRKIKTSYTAIEVKKLFNKFLKTNLCSTDIKDTSKINTWINSNI